METMGSRLKRLREARGLSQGVLAKRAGLKSQGAIGNIERDTRGYGASIIDIARELQTTPEYLRLEIADVSAPAATRALYEITIVLTRLITYVIIAPSQHKTTQPQRSGGEPNRCGRGCSGIAARWNCSGDRTWADGSLKVERDVMGGMRRLMRELRPM